MLLFAWLAGCATVAPAPWHKGDVYLWKEGRRLDQAELARRLERARLVLVGETHHHPGHHQVQLQVLRLMAAGNPAPVVGVEWLPAGAQPACDRLSAGEITVREFARLVDWKHTWGYPLTLYAPILEEVRRRHLKLVALNAPTAVVRQVAHRGLKSLGPNQRAQLAPALDLEDPPYRRLMAQQFKSHGGMGGLREEDFFIAQVARDETMAHHMARALEPWPDGGRRGLVLVGSGHLTYRLGLPPRLARRLPGADPLVILPVGIDLAGELENESRPPADILVFTDPTPPRPRGRPRLGLVLQPVKEGLRVQWVFPGYPAHKAGVQAGDLLVELDGHPLKRVKDIHRSLRDAPYAAHSYVILRKGRRLELKIRLDRPSGP